MACVWLDCYQNNKLKPAERTGARKHSFRGGRVSTRVPNACQKSPSPPVEFIRAERDQVDPGKRSLINSGAKRPFLRRSASRSPWTTKEGTTWPLVGRSQNGLACDKAGNVYVASSVGNTIEK